MTVKKNKTHQLIASLSNLEDDDVLKTHHLRMYG